MPSNTETFSSTSTAWTVAKSLPSLVCTGVPGCSAVYAIGWSGASGMQPAYGRVREEELADACAQAFHGVDPQLSYTPESLADEPSCSTGPLMAAKLAQVPGEEPGCAFSCERWDAGMPAHVRFECLLFRPKGVEQLESHLPIVVVVIPLE